jgi:hypothetical protein
VTNSATPVWTVMSGSIKSGSIKQAENEVVSTVRCARVLVVALHELQKILEVDLSGKQTSTLRA